MTGVPGIVLAAPATGSGKTTLTLGLLRALKRRSFRVAPAKVGPDYIDPAFHERASGRICCNLDGWAMQDAVLAGVLALAGEGAQAVLAEGVMGLFDGANVAEGYDGSTADVAARCGWPVVLVLDCARMGASAGAVLKGFAGFRFDVQIAGVILNRLSGPSHLAMVERACRQAQPGIPILGRVPREDGLALPSRHLGLVQAAEHPDLEGLIERAADLVAAHVDLEALIALAKPSSLNGAFVPPLPPLGGRVAVARDEAFAFAYPAQLEGWRRQGAALSFFSPLAGEGPSREADAVFLPGGYPELHGSRLANASGFLKGLSDAAARGAWIYGECGGFMALGRSVVDAEGRAHAMAGLLPLTTSFQKRRLHLGYRGLAQLSETPFGPAGSRFRGHEFHYATILDCGPGDGLFDAVDAGGGDLGVIGLKDNRVFGSFAHLIAG